MIMPKTRQDDPKFYKLGTRAYALAAIMLDTVNQAEWEQRGLSKGDAIMAPAMACTFLRVNSIELGLKALIDDKMGQHIRDQHNLAALWDRLTDKWRERVVEAMKADTTSDEVRKVLAKYKMGSTALRYGGPLGVEDPNPPTPASIQRNLLILSTLTNALVDLVAPPISVAEVKPEADSATAVA